MEDNLALKRGQLDYLMNREGDNLSVSWWKGVTEAAERSRAVRGPTCTQQGHVEGSSADPLTSPKHVPPRERQMSRPGQRRNRLTPNVVIWARSAGSMGLNFSPIQRAVVAPITGFRCNNLDRALKLPGGQGTKGASLLFKLRITT
ncbi:unnamed protein product [Nezara viridula]|uniref:Uncharacterized protein n=1 Tax=Nezara viridula TaxID=85310 RepID=A0A9P0MRU3_NEZVI|nr:unnamed protein product [Nezara viridula]